MAPSEADLKQTEPKDKASHFQGMTLMTMRRQIPERRVKLRKQRVILVAGMKPGAEIMQKRRDGSEICRGFYRPPAVGFMGGSTWFKDPRSG